MHFTAKSNHLLGQLPLHMTALSNELSFTPN